MDINSSLQKLFSLHKFGIKLGLENTVNFLDYLGNPQQSLNAIHIAGSNGKGSTASFIASILQESGYKTGLYTSPHFVKFNERIQVNSKLINDEYIAEFITEHENYIDQHELTFFEVTTAMAFKFFELNKTDFCVIETGLGGRLDATNVLNPLAVVITSISLEHTNVLGNTLREIATEKAAIIKRGAKVFTGLLKSEAVQVISEKCSQLNCELFMLKDYIRKDELFIVTLTSSPVQLTEIPLKGKYQFHNAALAALAVSKTFESESLLKIEDGIKNVINNTNIQGRYEYLQRNPDIIFDSAHNPEAVENFINELRQEDYQGKKVLLFGAMKDKAINEMLSILKQYFDSIFIAEIEYERFAKPEDMQNICQQLQFETSIVKEPAEFVKNFVQNSKDDCLVVLGSMYLLGEIKSKLLVNVT